VLLTPAGAIAAVPEVRETVRNVLGIKGVSIERAPSPLAVSPEGQLALGKRIAPAVAERRVAFGVVTLAPRALGAPDETYYRPFPPGGALSLVYRSKASARSDRPIRGRLVLTEFLGATVRVVRKFVAPGTSVEVVSVAGERGVWFSGRPHYFGYLDAHGRLRGIRLVGNTLLWQRGPLTLRLEGASSRTSALRLAVGVIRSEGD
jgi:hypothetical protein